MEFEFKEICKNGAVAGAYINCDDCIAAITPDMKIAVKWAWGRSIVSGASFLWRFNNQDDDDYIREAWIPLNG